MITLDDTVIQKPLECLLSKENMNQNIYVHCEYLFEQQKSEGLLRGGGVNISKHLYISMPMQSSTIKFHIYSYKTIFCELSTVWTLAFNIRTSSNYIHELVSLKKRLFHEFLI